MPRSSSKGHSLRSGLSTKQRHVLPVILIAGQRHSPAPLTGSMFPLQHAERPRHYPDAASLQWTDLKTVAGPKDRLHKE